MNRTIPILLALLMLAPVTAANVVDNHTAVVAGADRLLQVQNDDGSMPWIIGQTAAYMNVQGISAMGLIEAYKLTGNSAYLAGAEDVRDWLAAWIAANPGKFVSSSNIYFLAEYALLSGELADLELAREALDSSINDARSGSPANLINGIITVRHTSHKLGALGLWDAALFVRAAQDVGAVDIADEMAAALAGQTIVDAFDSTQTYHELGLSGLLFGLGEADMLAHDAVLAQASAALAAARCENGSYPTTYRGVVYCDDVQSTAFAAMGFTHVGQLTNALPACDWLVGAQGATGGWDLGGYEIAEVDAEAVAALAGCVAPARNGATSYVDAVVGLL